MSFTSNIFFSLLQPSSTLFYFFFIIQLLSTFIYPNTTGYFTLVTHISIDRILSYVFILRLEVVWEKSLCILRSGARRKCLCRLSIRPSLSPYLSSPPPPFLPFCQFLLLFLFLFLLRFLPLPLPLPLPVVLWYLYVVHSLELSSLFCWNTHK